MAGHQFAGGSGDDEDRFGLAAAMRARGDEELARWVGEFLASPGSDNAELAAALATRRRWWLGPVRLELDRLRPLAGPPEGDDGDTGAGDGTEVVCPIDEDEWEADVAEMRASLAAGWEPPPLLAEHRDGELLLQDGNHRWEVLRRAGETHGWVIVWFDHEADRERFAASVEDDALPADRSGDRSVANP